MYIVVYLNTNLMIKCLDKSAPSTDFKVITSYKLLNITSYKLLNHPLYEWINLALHKAKTPAALYMPQ